MDLMGDKLLSSPVKVGELIALLNGLKVDISMVVPPDHTHGASPPGKENCSFVYIDFLKILWGLLIFISII